MRLPMVFASFFAVAHAAQFGLPAFFSDHMVLQRGKVVPVWGWDKPGRTVKVTVNGQSTFAITPPDGKFRAMLPPMLAGGPFELIIEGSETRTIHDVYVGEVWICSGQSNMEWIQRNALDREQAKTETDPHVRMFTVTKKISNVKMDNVTGSWETANSESIDNFSAVGYAFARKLYRDLKVPIGMIHTSWGGTPAEAWTSIDMLGKDVMTQNIATMAKTSLKGVNNGMPEYLAAMKKWQEKGVPDFFGPHSEDAAKPGFDDTSWSDAPMPFMFPETFDGTIWFRKEVILTTGQAKAIGSLSLGAIDDLDMTFVNGKEIGRTDMTVPGYYSVFRKYALPAGLLHGGKNIIAVRAYDGQGPGGFTGTKADLMLGDISIANGWKMKIEGAKKPAMLDAGPEPQSPDSTNSPNFPETLYNGMVYPLAPYGIRGAIWYQGESNAGRAVQYRFLLSNMIRDWRKIFRQDDFPFYIVQLANFMKADENQFDSAWAELRDAQDIVGQEKNCGVATILDIGDPNDIHPKNKRAVGERLARIALKKDYAQNVEWQGPRFEKASFAGATATISFTHANGLTTRDQLNLRCFAVAGEDRKWHWATGKIVGSTVLLTCSEVQTPIAVRYGWQDNPFVNLVNSDGLPAMPFRTDSWPLLTRDNR